MKFRFKADVCFEAENIDDAFEKIGKYFLKLAEKGTEAELDALFTGEFKIDKIKEGGAIGRNK